MIRIGSPQVESVAGSAYLKARVSVDDETARRYIAKTAVLKNCAWLTAVDYPPTVWRETGISTERSELRSRRYAGCELWFRVPAEYGERLCTERSDAFVVAMLWYAMLVGSDIEFETPMSKRLHQGLTEKLLPTLAEHGAGRIRLLGPVSDAVLPCAGAVGTGMSCGVDSFYTMMTHGTGSQGPLTHLTYYAAGLHVPPGSDDVEKTYAALERVGAENIRMAAAVSAASGLPFVSVVTNLDRDFYRGGVAYTAMYRYLACTLALGRLFGTYVSSSSGHVGDLGAGVVVPTQNYERLICDCCQTETLAYVNSDEVARTEKLKVVADNPLFQRYASVCFNDCACGECIGCWKTMFPLDILGKLDLFGGVFDLPRYYARREELVRSFVRYAAKPELASVKVTLEQLVRLAESESGDSAVRFRELLKTAMMA